MGVVFTVTPRGPKFSPFLFYQEWQNGKVVSTSMLIHVEDYCYYFWEHVCAIGLFKIIYTDTSAKWRLFVGSAFAWQILDVMDYLLTYNTEWAYVGGVQVSSNAVAAVGLVLVLIFNAWMQQHIKQLSR